MAYTKTAGSIVGTGTGHRSPSQDIAKPAWEKILIKKKFYFRKRIALNSNVQKL